MGKGKRLRGRERREVRRRARQGPQLPKLPRRRFLWIGAGGATAAAIAVVLALVAFAGDGGGGAAPSVSGSPTAQSTPTAADTGPPAVAGEPTVTATGLKFIDTLVGTGGSPTPGETLVVHYTGWLTEGGAKFDSSLDRGKPLEFLFGASPAKVIQGWEEGLATMKVGGKRRLIIPPELAYGASGQGSIPPNANLTFDVELLEVK